MPVVWMKATGLQLCCGWFAVCVVQTAACAYLVTIWLISTPIPRRFNPFIDTRWPQGGLFLLAT